jgi:hypothetical protein
VAFPLKAGIVESAEIAFARQWPGKDIVSVTALMSCNNRAVGSCVATRYSAGRTVPLEWNT